MRNLVVLTHVIWILVFTYLLVFVGLGPSKYELEDYLIVLSIYIPPLVTLYYLYTHPQEGENLISLWIKVREKKLKEELEKK